MLECGGERLEDVSVTRLSEQVQYYHDAPSVLTVLRDGEEISVELTPAYDEESNLWMFGFDLTSKVVESWSQRSLHLIEAGFKGSRLEMVVQYRFSNKQGKTNDSYAKILLDFDRNGQV